MKPTVGRIVHFYNHALPADANNHAGAGPYAAIVTQVLGEYVNLAVFHPLGEVMSATGVGPKEHDPRRHWVWPV